MSTLARIGRLTGFGGKTLWDWLALLLVPAGLAIVVFLLDDAQTRRDGKRAAHEATRAREAELDRRRSTLLQDYIAQMSGLMLDHGLSRRTGGKPVGHLATTLTRTVVAQLDGRRKAQVLLFLDSARLLDGMHSLDTSGMDFRGTDARGMAFFEPLGINGADFRDARFDDAVVALRDSDDVGAQFFDTDLAGASFRRAVLHVEFNVANLTDTDFVDARLLSGSFSGSCLTRASLRGALLQNIDFDGVTADRIDLTRSRLLGSTLRRGRGRAFIPDFSRMLPDVPMLQDERPVSARWRDPRRHARCFTDDPTYRPGTTFPVAP